MEIKKKNGMRALSVILAAMLVCVAFTPAVSAYDNPEESWTEDDSTYYGGINAYIASTTGYFGGQYISGRDVYEFTFRMTGVGETRDTYSNPTTACRIQALEITETYNNAHQAIWTSTDPVYVGAWPRDSGSSAYYYNVAYKVSLLAISAINSYAGFAISAADLVLSLLSGYDDGEDGETIWREWDHSTDQTDVGHFFWWLVDVDPGETVRFSVDDYLFGPSYEMIGVGWNFEIATPSKSPDKMTEAEREKYGIEIIPINELKQRSEELNIAPETVDELIRYGEPVYYAHKIPVKAIPVKPDKEAAISRLLERTGYSKDLLFDTTNPLAASTDK